MTIAELFVKLGIKGADKAGKQIGGIDKKMGGLKKTSLATKAAVVGLIYGMQRMMSSSAKIGTDMLNLSEATGISAKSLQQWRYAGQQFGATAGEVDGAIVGMQSRMTDMLTGEGVPKWLNILSDKVSFDWQKGQENPLYAMSKAQEMMQELAKTNPGFMKKFGDSFGFSNNIIAAMKAGGFNQKVFDRAPTYGKGELKSLRRVDAQWKNFFQKFEMAVGRLNAAFGPDVMRVLQHLADAVLGLTEAWLKKAGNTADWIDAFKMSPEERKKKGITLPFVDQSWEEIFGLDEGSKAQTQIERRKKQQRIEQFKNRSIMDMFRGRPSTGPANDKSAAVFNMKFEIGNGAEPQEVAFTVKKAVNDAYGELFGKGLTV